MERLLDSAHEALTAAVVASGSATPAVWLEYVGRLAWHVCAQRGIRFESVTAQVTHPATWPHITMWAWHESCGEFAVTVHCLDLVVG